MGFFAAVFRSLNGPAVVPYSLAGVKANTVVQNTSKLHGRSQLRRLEMGLILVMTTCNVPISTPVKLLPIKPGDP